MAPTLTNVMRLVAFLLILVATAAFADMTIVETIKTGPIDNQPSKTIVSTMYIRGTRARIVSDPASPQIVDLKAGKVYLLNPAGKEATVVPIDVMKKAGNVLQQLGATNMTSSFTKTGESKTLNGFKCTGYRLKGSGPLVLQADYWVTDSVDTKEFEPFKPLLQDMVKMLGSDALAQMKGITIQTTLRITMMGQVVDSSDEIQSISYKPLSDTLFEVPKEFKLVPMPEMPANEQTPK